ncbi:hypothetical protein [Flavitalea sp.]|nr:hypothetical protein [Flavitalea sp.]
MISQKNKYQNNSLGRSLLAVVMIFLLLFLTTANFFFFSVDSKSSYSLMSNQDDESEAFPCSPSGPDEKAPGGPVSFSEEYIHGHLEISDFLLSNRLFKHLITASEKIELIHFELLSPPPEC